MPDRSAGVEFRVEDSLKVYPSSIRIGEVDAGEPIHREFCLYTIADRDVGALPKLRVSSGAIKASIASAGGLPDVLPRGYKAHFSIRATIMPPPEQHEISGAIDVLGENDRELLSTPVHCSYKREYLLSADHVDAEGVPGTIITRELFLESISPDWRDVAVSAAPDGVAAKIVTFDSRTKVVRIRVRIPEADRGQNERLILRSADGKKTIEIPFRFAARRG